MTVEPAAAPRVKGYVIQFLVLLSINVPTVSFGLAMGWVSLASGGAEGEGGGGGEGALVGAAAATFAAGLVAGPLAARALAFPRRPLLAATSAAFAVSWALTLAGGWCVVAARLVAGLAGAFAWTLAPVLGNEMLSANLRGAAAATPGLGHNIGMLLMYLASDARLQHSTVVCGSLALCALHGAAAFLAPESPAFLAAQGHHKEAARALARLRGLPAGHPALEDELRDLPPPDTAPTAIIPLAKEMLSDRRRRRAFIIALVAVVGQEACGVLTLLQFAERVFVLAGDGAGIEEGVEGEGWEASRYAVLLGVVQLVTSAAALYLVERVGRRPLVVWGAVGTGACLALAAGGARAGRGRGAAGGALAAAVAADSLALQPAPYALLADMFHYQYRGCAVALVLAAGSAGNAAETLILPAVVHAAGLWAALSLAAAVTLLYAIFAILYVPETRNRTPDQIYDVICPKTADNEAGDAERKDKATDPTISDEEADTVNNNKIICPDTVIDKDEHTKEDHTNQIALDGASKTEDRNKNSLDVLKEEVHNEVDKFDEEMGVNGHRNKDMCLNISEKDTTKTKDENKSLYSHDKEVTEINMNKEKCSMISDEESGKIASNISHEETTMAHDMSNKATCSKINDKTSKGMKTENNVLHNSDYVCEIGGDMILRLSRVKDVETSVDNTNLNDLNTMNYIINHIVETLDEQPKCFDNSSEKKHVTNDSCEGISERHEFSTSNSSEVSDNSVVESNVTAKSVVPSNTLDERYSEETRFTKL